MSQTPTPAMDAVSASGTATGTVTLVRTRTVGTYLVDDAAAGATVLLVDSNAQIFPGNTLRLTHPDPELAVPEQLLTVADVAELDQVHLVDPLPSDVVVNSLLERTPAAPEVVAFVRLSETTEPVPCLVNHGLADALPTGTRDETTAETVVLEQRDGALVVVDVVTRTTVRDLTNADPTSVPVNPELQQALDDLEASLLELNETTLPGLNSDLAANTEAIADLVEQTIPGLQTSLGELEGDLGTALQDLSAAQSDVTALEGRFPITGPDISAGAVTATAIGALAVTTAKLAAGAVTAAKITAATITATEISAGAITTAKLSAGAVTANEIAAGSVITAKLAAGAVTATEISAGAITTTKLAAGAVTANEIAAGAVTALKIAADAIDGKTITGALVRTASAGERIVLRNDGSGGIFESFAGIVGETPSVINPSANLGRPTLTLETGTAGSNTHTARMVMVSDDDESFVELNGDAVYSLSKKVSIQSSADGTSQGSVSLNPDGITRLTGLNEIRLTTPVLTLVGGVVDATMRTGGVGVGAFRDSVDARVITVAPNLADTRIAATVVGGTFQGNTSSNGRVTIDHTLGAVPAAVVPSNLAGNFHFISWDRASSSATQLVFVVRNVNNATQNSVATGFSWVARR